MNSLQKPAIGACFQWLANAKLLEVILETTCLKQEPGWIESSWIARNLMGRCHPVVQYISSYKAHYTERAQLGLP